VGAAAGLAGGVSAREAAARWLGRLAAGADASLRALGLHDLDAATLMAERAALMGHGWNGAASPSGRCRLLEAADGWLALNLARDEDWTLMPAWLEQEGVSDWDAVAAAVRGRNAPALVERGREMGLAVALDGAPVAAGAAHGCDSFVATPVAAMGRSRRKAPRVLDLSSLWAGPLCGDLLRRLGADVVKVESVARPDGARAGPPLFFDLLNAGKRSVALDLRAPSGIAALRRLIARADIVIESARPRALRQLGIEAEELVRAHPGLTWVSITGYGRSGPEADWIAYGDDAGVAAGLSHLVWRETGERVMVGDAVADPLTGIHGALAAWQAYCEGGGLVALSLTGTVRSALAAAGGGVAPAFAPRGRALAMRSAPALGADTAAVLAAWAAESPTCTRQAA
jgi:hypothetical protein